MIPADVERILAKYGTGRVTFLTGAGLSAASGIPTFRGPEGYWKVGSVNYRPEAMATRSMFRRHPQRVWEWYLYRRGVCKRAQPNVAHEAIARFVTATHFASCITQNVDGLHAQSLEALSYDTDDLLMEVHGNIHYARCARDCTPSLVDVPMLPPTVEWDKNRTLTEAEFRHFRCQRCGGMLRPHILWFDESYDSHGMFEYAEACSRLQHTDLLVIIGSSGAANMPHMALGIAQDQQAGIIMIDIEESDLTWCVDTYVRGAWWRATSEDATDALVSRLFAFRA